MTRAIRALSILIGPIANLIPLLGVLYWPWDTFQLLMLYWLETVIIIAFLCGPQTQCAADALRHRRREWCAVS